MLSFWNAAAADLAAVLEPSGLAVLGQVVLIDVMLAADNAVVLGTLASGFPAERRRRIVAVGIAAALVLRIGFALVASALLHLSGLVFAGGLLLVWVAWKMWRDLRAADEADAAIAVRSEPSFLRACVAVAVADLGMSLDNVLGVAGAARAHPALLVLGLVLSVLLVGGAANLLAAIISRHRRIAYCGVAAILYVAARMLQDGLFAAQIGLLAH